MFSMWSFFGLTLWIDIGTHVFKRKKNRKIDPYNPVREVSVLIPIHKEPIGYIKQTIDALYYDRYPLKNVIICGDKMSANGRDIVKRMMGEYNNLIYLESPHQSKAKKINYAVNELKDALGEFVYLRDCRVYGYYDCIEKMVSYFSDDNVAAVTSYGRVNTPKNFLSRCFFYGKSWVNDMGRFRKNAQEKRKAIFVICGASTLFRTEVIRKVPIPGRTKTEDAHYTWILQRKGYEIRVADDATVAAPEVDGETLFDGIKAQIKQSYRWSVGTTQTMYVEGRGLFKNKRLAYTTIVPGFFEAVSYAVPLVLIPLLLYIIPFYAMGFLIGDTIFSLLATLIIMPKKFGKTVLHYPQIMFFKYINALVFFAALSVVTTQAVTGKSDKWSNEWISPDTGAIGMSSIGNEM